MKKIVKVAVIAAMLGTAQLAAAQTPTGSQGFADSFSYMQSLSSPAPTYHAQPTLSAKPDDPIQDRSFAETFARMQALSSNSGEFKQAPVISAQAADPVGEESFADRFALMQAESSKSGEFKFPVSADEPAFATTDGPNVANNAAQSTSSIHVSSARADSRTPSRN